MSTGPGAGGFRISGRVMALIIVAAVAAGIFFTVASIYLNAAPTSTTEMSGVLYVDSSGQMNGTSQYAATYNASLSSVSGTGTLNFTLLSDSADLLTVHSFTVTNVTANPYELNLTIDGTPVTLSWINNSTVWKDHNESYVGSWSPNAPQAEVVGVFTSQDLPGIPANDYVFLALTVPSQPPDTIPFVLHSLS